MASSHYVVMFGENGRVEWFTIYPNKDLPKLLSETITHMRSKGVESSARVIKTQLVKDGKFVMASVKRCDWRLYATDEGKMTTVLLAKKGK